MTKYVELAAITNGKMSGELFITAEYWENRYSWGHVAEIRKDYATVARCKYRYYNRRWESYRFESVLHGAIYAYVKAATGCDVYKSICKRDTMPMKGKDAEIRRLERVAAYEFAEMLKDRLCAIVDGTATAEQFAEEDKKGDYKNVA